MRTRLESLYERMLSARSDVDAYQLSIEIEREASPLELDRIYRDTVNRITATALATRLSRAHQLSIGSNTPEPYECVFSSQTVCHYRAIGSRCAPRMLVALCGKAQVLFGPVARVLQYFPAANYEVLVLRDPAKLGYTGGLSGLGSDFKSAMSALRDRFIRDDMEIVTLGCSGGGGAALVAATLLSAGVGVSFSGRLPTTSPIYGGSASAIEMERILCHAAPSKRRFSAIYGELHEPDIEQSMRLATRCGAGTVVVPGFSGHNVLHELHLRGDLAHVLQETGLLRPGTSWPPTA